MQIHSRRRFLQFLGYGAVISSLPLLKSCNENKNIFPSIKDDLILHDGLSYYKVISWGDQINSQEVFGFNNDYINIYKLSPNELIMWVNHEYINPIFVSGFERSAENIEKEKSLVGGSLIHLKKKDNHWVHFKGDKYNKGVRGNTMIPFNANIEVKGSKEVEGTLANCAGGKTPWNTFLTCEENYDQFYGERKSPEEDIDFSGTYLHWNKTAPQNLPEHYGWVVEVDPKTGKAKKHTNLGRFAHESATCVKDKSGNVVVYSGDDKINQHLYKFISDSGENFDSGTLYAANIETGTWLALDLEKSPLLKEHFNSQLDVHIYARKAAKLLGATELNRPEDIEINPITGDVFVALTNNKSKGDLHGSILKISEDNGSYNSLSFKSETFLLGGESSNFSCPDNMAFDQNGNLWFATDISGSKVGKPPYEKFGNNGLFVVPVTGNMAGQAVQVASAPTDAELTGLCFTEDYKTLFLSVQHPGERTKDLKSPTSFWPDGGMPKPSVVAIHGAFLESLTRKA